MTHINFHINAIATSLATGSTVRDLVSAHVGKDLNEAGAPVDGSRLGIAVAVNGAVVPRSSWNEFVLFSGHQVDLVTAAQGG